MNEAAERLETRESRPADPRKVVVLRDRYQTSFMTPRASRHRIVRKPFVPFNYVSSSFDGFTTTGPSFGTHLTHAHNRIPLGARRSIMSFESHMPRLFGIRESGVLHNMLERHLLSPSCRRIVGMSHFAKRIFLDQHRELSPEKLEILKSKLMVRHPSVELVSREDTYDAATDTGPLKLVFVGGHFARKGGCVAVEIARKAHARALPVEVTIISAMGMGESVWTDPTLPGALDAYTSGPDLPNLTMMGAQPNNVVRQLFAESHFGLLPTIADTFGFSAIECMAEHTPMIVTRSGALPEFVSDGENGLHLDLDVTPAGEWAGLDYGNRHTAAYAEQFRNMIDDLAEQSLQRLVPYLEDRTLLVPMRRAARQTVEDMFDAKRAGQAWDALYDRVIAEDAQSEVRLDPELDWSAPERWPGAQQHTN